MLLAGFDLLLGARVSLLAAVLLVGCSGSGEDAATSEREDAASTSDSSRGPDAGNAPDVADRADRNDHAIDMVNSDSSVADVQAIDIAADVPALALCLRLMDPLHKGHELELSQAVDDQYILLIFADCRVYKAIYPPGGSPAYAAWRNALYAYNLDLWGCSDKPATDFALVSAAIQGVSSADATQLIELYLKAATNVLGLSTREAADLRRDLQRLSGPVVTNESTEYTLSNCPPDSGAIVDAVSSESSDTASLDAEAGSVAAEAGSLDAEAGSVDGATADVDVEAEAASEGGD